MSKFLFFFRKREPGTGDILIQFLLAQNLNALTDESGNNLIS